MFQVFTDRRVTIEVMALIALIASSGALRAQEYHGRTQPQSAITGVVKDASGAALPGVTVEATSPALVDRVRSAVTDAAGEYKLADLPFGIYTISFNLAGFNTFKRDGVEVTAAVPATVNVEMSVAALRETVTVTARILAEDLQKVPQSVAALGTEDLRAQSIQRLSDLGQVTPNLLYGQKIQSGSSAGQVYIRGIGQQDTKAAFSPGVGISVDGVYMGRAQANDLDMADVERVEVLYGPQGTLFGKNSDGGAINIVTKMPEISASRPSGMVELQTGDFSRISGRVLLDVPLATDRAALQATGGEWHRDGYSTRTNGQHQANENRNAESVYVLLRPSDEFQIWLRADGSIFNEESGAYRLVAVRTTSTIPVLYAAAGLPYDNRWVTKSDFEYNGTGPNKNAGNVWGTSVTLEWDRPWATLKSISAYRKLHVDSEFDPDGSPYTILDVFNPIDQHQVSQEFQATGTSFNKRLPWVAGLFYFRERARDPEGLNIGLEVFHGAANLSYNSYYLNQNPAVFGQATYDLTDNLKLTVGGRLSADTVNAQRIQTGYPDTTVVQQPWVFRSAHWTYFLPRVGLDYRWTSNLMTYVSAAEGSKSGGFNGRASSPEEFTQFEPEKVWAYEVGLRSEWFDQRLRFNATAYYSDYRNFQILLNRSKTDPVTGQPVPYSFVGNMPKARIAGGEYFFSATPFRSLLVSAGLGITDGKYIRIIPGAPVTTNTEFVDAPKYTVTSGVQYFQSTQSVGQLTAGLNYIHKSRIQYDYGNSPLVAQAPYGLLNSRLTWQPPRSPLSFFIFGTNLTNTHYADGGLDDGPGGSLGEVIKLMGPPREWGLGGQFRF